MAEGQNLGGIYISIDADIGNLKTAVNRATEIVNKFQSSVKDMKLVFDDSGIKKTITTLQELSKTLSTVYTDLGAKTKSIVDSTQKLSQAQIKTSATQKTLSEAMRVYQDLLTKTGQVTRKKVQGYIDY